MMNRKSAIILSVIFLLTSVSLFGQEVTFTLGEKNKYKDIKLLKENNDGSIIASFTERDDKVLVKFSKDKYLLENSTKIELRLDKSSKKRRDRMIYLGNQIADDAIYVFASKYNSDIKVVKLYYSEYNLNLEIKKDWTLIDSVNFDYYVGFGIEKSAYNTRFIVTSNNYSKRKDATTLINTYSMFNSNFSLQFKSKVVHHDLNDEYKVGFRKLIFSDDEIYSVNNYISSKTVIHQISKNDTDSNFENLRRYEVVLLDKDIVDVKWGLNKNGDLIIAGLYSAKGDANGEDKGFLGVYYIQVDGGSMQEKILKTIPFSEDFLSTFISNRKISKGRGLPNTYRLKDLVINEISDATLIIEEEYTTTSGGGPRGFMGSSSTPVSSTGHNDDLVLVGLNEIGDLKYFSTIDKKGFSSDLYNCFPISDGLLLFYNDFYRNGKVGKSKIQKLVGANNNALVKAFIDNDGNVTKDVVITNNNSKVEFEPKNCIKTSNSKGLLMLGTKRNKLKIIRIDVK